MYFEMYSRFFSSSATRRLLLMCCFSERPTSMIARRSSFKISG
jgi:hypothetical protein